MYRCAILSILLISCSSSGTAPSTESPTSGLTSTQDASRPGVQNSSKAFIGELSPAETAFWNAVRDGDDAARQDAVAQLKADVTADPTNGYSSFLAGASPFIATVDNVQALATGQPGSGLADFPDDTAPLLKQALADLKDPFYIGFAAILLAGIQVRTDYIAAGSSQQLATENNYSASSVGRTIVAIAMRDPASALDIMYNWLKYCNNGSLDRANPDMTQFVSTANAGGFVQRECYSGAFGSHGTEGELLLTGDLFAIAGNTDTANLYYNAIPQAKNYDSWPLRPLVQRRIDNSQPVVRGDLQAVASCTTCHTEKIP